MSPKALNEPLLPTPSQDEDCERLTQDVTSSNISTKFDSDNVVAAGGTTSSLSSHGHEKINACVLAVLILFSSSGMCHSVRFLLE